MQVHVTAVIRTDNYQLRINRFSNGLLSLIIIIHHYYCTRNLKKTGGRGILVSWANIVQYAVTSMRRTFLCRLSPTRKLESHFWEHILCFMQSEVNLSPPSEGQKSARASTYLNKMFVRSRIFSFPLLTKPCLGHVSFNVFFVCLFSLPVTVNCYIVSPRWDRVWWPSG